MAVMVEAGSRPKHLNREWVQSLIEWIWGFRLKDFQLDDLMDLLGGGIYAVMYPTDHGKSMLIEIAVVVGLIWDPQRKKLVIKINDDAAQTTSAEIARRLELASDRYPEVRPQVYWRNGEPYGLTKGFWIKGADRLGGRRHGLGNNKSVTCYGLGARNLQGARGDTFIDDIETQEEAQSHAYRERLKTRVSAVMRTLPDDPLATWAMFGTPTHEESVYFDIAPQLQELGQQFKEIHRPLKNADGSFLMPERARKIEVHRRTMTKTEFAAAYELRPRSGRRVTAEMLDELKRPDLPLPDNEEMLRQHLISELVRQCPHYRDPRHWYAEVLNRLDKNFEVTVNWDPAGGGDWGGCVSAFFEQRIVLCRAHLGTEDTYGQADIIAHWREDFPSAAVVIESNGQQKAFRDVLAEVDPDAFVVKHGTFQNKDSEKIGLPALVKQMVVDGWLEIPWSEEERCELEFNDFLHELRRWGPTAHPHILASLWFGWYWVRQHAQQAREERREKRLTPAEALDEVVRYRLNEARRTRIAPLSQELRERTRGAWRRTHRRG